MERRPSQEGDSHFRPRDNRVVERQFRAAGAAHRDLRPGRHAMGRASDLHAGRLLLRSRAGGREGEARPRKRGAVQDRALGRSRGCRQAVNGRSPQDRCRNADRHGCRRFPRRGRGMDRRRPRSALATALHGSDLPAANRAPELSARRRLQDLHRHRRRPGFRAGVCGAGLRHPARAGGRQRRRPQL